MLEEIAELLAFFVCLWARWETGSREGMDECEINLPAFLGILKALIFQGCDSMSLNEQNMLVIK